MAVKAAWYLKRISRMSATEMAHRARDHVLITLWRRRRGALGAPAPRQNAVRLDLPAAAAAMASSAARRALLSAADNLLDGEWTLFGTRVAGFGSAIDWFRDPKTGRRANARSYCFDVPHRDESAVGNVKFLWEASRHHHLTVLAAAYRLTGDERYAERVAEHLESWWEANPFLTGINWTSGIEIGLRLIAWVWLRRLLAGWGGVQTLFEANATFVAQLYRHQQYLAALRSQGSSANNHLLAEAAGLFAASTAFPLFRQSPKWRRDAARILESEIHRQVDDQGLNRELATDYHGFVLELLLVVAIEGDAANAPLSEEFWRRVQAMMDALAAMVDATGRPPRQGDSDDGTALLLDAPAYDRWQSLLATGERLFAAAAWWPPTKGGDIRTAFLTSIATARRHLGKRLPNRPALFHDAGLVILRHAPPGQPELWCRCDHGKHGFLSIAAHAHADALAIELRHGGVDILADPGTYCYHGEAAWRRYFRSTLGHNTLELGGIDQAVSGGAFLWLTHPVAQADEISGLENGPVATWVASHQGYAKSLGAVHHRSVALARRERRLVIRDWIESDRAQDGRLALHLGPAVTCRHQGTTAWLTWNVDGREFSGRLDLPTELTWTAHRGDDVAGWYSPKFAQKIPTTALIGAGKLIPSHHHVTTFSCAARSVPRRVERSFQHDLAPGGLTYS
jgi:hypothetical protein